MDLDTLAGHIEKAKSDASFFRALASDPSKMIPELGGLGQDIRDAMAMGASQSESRLHRYGAYDGCKSTSCGCGGSI